VGSELFPWVIVLVALAMAADWIVANRFYAPRDDAEPTRAAAAFAADGAEPGGPPPVPAADPRPMPPPVPSSEVPA